MHLLSPVEPNSFSAPILLLTCTIDKAAPEWVSRRWRTLPRELICFRICLINSFIVLANDCECFCCFSRTWNCSFRVVVADWKANRLWGTLSRRSRPSLGSEARFQVQRRACFWCYGRYEEWWVFSPKLKPIYSASIHAIHFCEFSYSSSYGPISRPCCFLQLFFAVNMTWARWGVFWDVDFEPFGKGVAGSQSSTKILHFFLNYAARVITTAAVIELCKNCHC